jgi:hypothetical protein
MTLTAGSTSGGCTNYSVSAGSGSPWSAYIGIASNGLPCYFYNQQRLFQLSNVQCGGAYSLSYVTPPATCKCIAPLDIAFSMLLYRVQLFFSQFLIYFVVDLFLH